MKKEKFIKDSIQGHKRGHMKDQTRGNAPSCEIVYTKKPVLLHSDGST